MKYPKYLETRVDVINSIISKWSVEKKLTEVMSWILQFENSDYDLAIRILKNLNVVSSEDLNVALTVAYSKLLRHAKERGEKISTDNTIYMAIGRDGKSGAMIAYNFRMINQLSSANFISKDSLELIKGGKIQNLVLVDDIIATGDQSSVQLKNISEKAHKLNIQNIYVVSAFGFKKGIDKIAETEVADVFAAVEYDENDTVASMDSIFYDGLSYDKRKKILERITKLYKGLGYKDSIGALITFYYNTPNCSIGAIWKNDDGWIPLFPRKFDAKADALEMYELDELLKQAEDVKVIEKTECSIYVEGKTMELFLQEVAKRNNHFGYTTLSIASIGPFYSKSLIDSLTSFSHKTIFITNEPEDSQTPHALSMNPVMEGQNLIRIDSIMNYFDSEKIKGSEKFIGIIDRGVFDESTSPEARNSILEMKLFKRNYRTENMIELITNCSDDEAIKGLVDKLRK